MKIYNVVYDYHNDIEFTLQFTQRSFILGTDFTNIAHIYVNEKEVIL